MCRSKYCDCQEKFGFLPPLATRTRNVPFEGVLLVEFSSICTGCLSGWRTVRTPV